MGRTRTAEISGTNGVVMFRALPQAIIDESAARENNAIIETLGGDCAIRVLADIRGLKRMTREARTYSRAFADRRYRAVALVVGNPVSRVIGNFFVGLNRPSIETRLFDDETEALAWLRALEDR